LQLLHRTPRKRLLLAAGQQQGSGAASPMAPAAVPAAPAPWRWVSRCTGRACLWVVCVCGSCLACIVLGLVVRVGMVRVGWLATCWGRGAGQQYGFQSGAGRSQFRCMSCFLVHSCFLPQRLAPVAVRALLAGLTATAAGTSLVWQRQLVHLFLWVQLDGLATKCAALYASVS
jgi:hypothetical protein